VKREKGTDSQSRGKQEDGGKEKKEHEGGREVGGKRGHVEGWFLGGDVGVKDKIPEGE